MTAPCVIVGAGHAAGQLVASLRSGGYSGRIVLLGEEPYLPYQRPPLSKHFLAGKVELERLLMRPAAFYAESAVEWLPDSRAVALDRRTQTLTLADGNTLAYERLALTTGARVRRLSVPGAALTGIHYVRTIADSLALRAVLQPGARVVIVGGGYIGLEVAAVAVRAGAQVTVLELATRLMARTATPQTAAFYADLHRAEGINLQFGVQVTGFAGTERVEQVLCSDGSAYAADVVVAGVGIIPNTELAAAAGLAVDDGIVVDEYARTTDPAIVAAGDCARGYHPRLGQTLRLESVPNAMAQARSAAATLCGKQEPYTELPWFWSDQYEIKLQMAGLAQGYDQTVVHGDPAAKKFSVFCFRQGAWIAVETINDPRAFMRYKQWLHDGRPLDPSAPLPSA